MPPLDTGELPICRPSLGDATSARSASRVGFGAPDDGITVTVVATLPRVIARSELVLLARFFRLDLRIRSTKLGWEPVERRLTAKFIYAGHHGVDAKELGRMAMGTALTATGLVDGWSGSTPGAHGETRISSVDVG